MLILQNQLMRLCPGKRSLQICQALGLATRSKRRGTRRRNIKPFCSRFNSSGEHPRSRKISTTRLSGGGGGGDGDSAVLAFCCLGGRQVGHEEICGPVDRPGNCVSLGGTTTPLPEALPLLCLFQETYQLKFSHSQFAGSHTESIGVATPSTRLYCKPRNTSLHVRQSLNSHL